MWNDGWTEVRGTVAAAAGGWRQVLFGVQDAGSQDAARVRSGGMMACGLLIFLVMIAIFWSWARGPWIQWDRDLRHHTRHSVSLPATCRWCTRQTRRFSTSTSGRAAFMSQRVPCIPLCRVFRWSIWARSSCDLFAPAPWQKFACGEIRFLHFSTFASALNLRAALIVHATCPAAAAGACPAGAAAGWLGCERDGGAGTVRAESGKWTSCKGKFRNQAD